MSIDAEFEIACGLTADDLDPLRKSRKSSAEIALLNLINRTAAPLIPRDKLFRNPLVERIEREAALREYTGEEPESPQAQTVQKLAQSQQPELSGDARELTIALFPDEPVAVPVVPGHVAALFTKARAIAERTAERKHRISSIVGTFKRDLLSKGFRLKNSQAFDRLQASCERYAADAIQAEIDMIQAAQ